MKMKTYRLAEYEITERFGEIWWKTHAGFGAARAGKCFIEGNILFLAPHCEADEASFLKNEFLEYLRKLPKWDRTKFYCTRFEIHECSTASTPKRRRPPGLTVPRAQAIPHADIEPGNADVKPPRYSEPEPLQDDFEVYLKGQATSLSDLGMGLVKGIKSVKSGLKGIKFWK
jgi:hypothetical protein